LGPSCEDGPWREKRQTKRKRMMKKEEVGDKAKKRWKAKWH
jgi:hypothetical protein